MIDYSIVRVMSWSARGRERCEDRQGGTLPGCSVERIFRPSCLFCLFSSFFLSFLPPSLSVVELICSVHVTKILPLPVHVCLSPIRPSRLLAATTGAKSSSCWAHPNSIVPHEGEKKMEKYNPRQDEAPHTKGKRKCRNAKCSRGPKRGYVGIPRDSKDMHGESILWVRATRLAWQKIGSFLFE